MTYDNSYFSIKLVMDDQFAFRCTKERKKKSKDPFHFQATKPREMINCLPLLLHLEEFPELLYFHMLAQEELLIDAAKI